MCDTRLGPLFTCRRLCFLPNNPGSRHTISFLLVAFKGLRYKRISLFQRTSLYYPIAMLAVACSDFENMEEIASAGEQPEPDRISDDVFSDDSLGVSSSYGQSSIMNDEENRCK